MGGPGSGRRKGAGRAKFSRKAYTRYKEMRKDFLGAGSQGMRHMLARSAKLYK
jgi:hypothetical protein